MKPRTRRVVKVKAWALLSAWDLIQYDDAKYHNACGMKYIFENRKQALNCKTMRDERVVPCTVTYALPPKKVRK